MKEKKIILVNELGESKEYTLLKKHKSTRLNKEYILYTDETYDLDDKLNIFAGIFDNNTISDIENEDEWNEVEGILEEYIKGA